jgi:redox-sensitive bicupin YhaK (pirin superfamily)
MYHGKKVPGFPGHPHRGFETITVVRKGMVDHADSMGAAGRYGDGDVQWMTAGGGVQHAEMFPLLSQENENPLELFQIWLNLPAKDKLVPPHFKMLWREDIPIYNAKSKKGNVAVEVIAGSLNGLKAVTPPPNSWAADPKNGVAIYNIKMDANTSFQLPKVADGIKTTIYNYVGNQVVVSGTTVPKYHRASLVAGHKHTIVNGDYESRILVLQGKPIDETVIQYGPFVMNSKQEIQEAFDDFHRTKFGGWPWPKYDQVHNRYAGRFAQHADGTREVKK